MNIMLHRANSLVLIAASIAAFAGASASIANAEPNNNQGPADDATCKQWKGWYDDDTKRAKDATTAGKAQAASDAQKDADYDKKLGKDGGCGWAAKAIVVSPHSRLHAAGVSQVVIQTSPAKPKAGAALPSQAVRVVLKAS